jgi:metallo-beta-lactamase family protein
LGTFSAQVAAKIGPCYNRGMVRLTFHGAAETVTGSKYLLEADAARVLVDCGLFQGLKQLRLLNWQPLPFPAASVQAVVLTHAHIDHIGYLPRFVRDGFRGPVYCTPATADLAAIMLFDAAKNQEEDARFANKKGFSKHKPALALYEPADVPRTLKLLKTVDREEWFSPAEPIWMRYHTAGHLLGASAIEVEIRDRPKPMRIVFSGDVGRYDAPLYFDPLSPPACDYLICESTYGNRDHPDIPVLDELAEVVNAAVARGGVMLCAAFAIGRSQQLIYLLRVLIQQKRIPTIPIFLDSPMAADATNIYCRYVADHDLSEGQLVGSGCVFDGPNIHETRTVAESKEINNVKGPAVIIASNGMMTGGRILHQLEQRLPHPANTIVVSGFQAAGTRGRQLVDGARFLRLYGHDVPVRAAVVSMSALSGHAGHNELIRWLAPLSRPKQTFITHGELPSASALASELNTTRGWNAVVPKLGQSFVLE